LWLIVFVLTVLLRFYQLGQNPVSLYWDEAAIAVDAYSISQTGRDMNNHHWLQPVLGSYGDFKAPVLIWLTSISVKFFGMEP
jgi:4-amino-4-deoxy-L-arabinose transferase-like glycosyltransferase